MKRNLFTMQSSIAYGQQIQETTTKATTVTFGCRRHVTPGLPHATAVTTAEVTDRKGALQALKRCGPALSEVQALLCDRGYVGNRSHKQSRTLGAHMSRYRSPNAASFASSR